MSGEGDPPRKVYGFKARAFTRDNPPATDHPTLSAQELARLSQAAPPATPPPPRDADRANASDPNDVFAVLQENRVREQQQGLDAIELRPGKSRKRRDYWLVLLGGNLLIVGGTSLVNLNVVSLLFAGSGLILFNLGVTWVMWQVIDDY